MASSALAWRGQVVGLSGQPLPRAEVYVLGRTGEAFTDDFGRFEWQPDPIPPFEVLIILPGGIHMKPVLVTTVDREASALLTVEPLLSEMVTVSGAAPGIDSAPIVDVHTHHHLPEAVAVHVSTRDRCPVDRSRRTSGSVVASMGAR